MKLPSFLLILIIFCTSKIFCGSAKLSISNCAQLQNISQNLAASYILSGDVDCHSSTLSPIGNSTFPFTGTLDGQGYRINNISFQINGQTTDTALFAFTNGATLLNLTIVNITSISNKGNAAGLVANAINTSINKCNVYGSSQCINRITSLGLYAGGVVANLQNSTITDSNVFYTIVYSNGSSGAAGGIAGHANASVIVNCHNLGLSNQTNVTHVSSRMNTGGVVGEMIAFSKISQCGILQGVVQGCGSNFAVNVGAVVGYLESPYQLIDQLYAQASVSLNASNSSAGGLIGMIKILTSGTVNMSNCYSQADLGGNDKVGGLVGWIFSLPGILTNFTFSQVYVSVCFVTFTNSTGPGYGHANLSSSNINIINAYYLNLTHITSSSTSTSSTSSSTSSSSTSSSTLSSTTSTSSTGTTTGLKVTNGAYPAGGGTISYKSLAIVQKRILSDEEGGTGRMEGSAEDSLSTLSSGYGTGTGQMLLYPDEKKERGDHLFSLHKRSPQSFILCPMSQNLVTTVNNTFDQCTIWSGVNLRIEPFISPQTPLRCPLTDTPTTQTLSTQVPTSSFPTTQIGTTNESTTRFTTSQTPTTQTPSTQVGVTNKPTTQTSTSSQTSSSQISSFLSATKPGATNKATTEVKTTSASSFPPQSTLLSSTLPPSTVTNTSLVPSTIPPTLSTHVPCPYAVVNCEMCSVEAPLADLTQVNVSCVFSPSQAIWVWTLTSINSQPFVNNQNFTVSSNTTAVISGNVTNLAEIIVSGNSAALIKGNFNNSANLNISTGAAAVIEGNFTQTSSGQITFVFNPSSQQQVNNKSAPLNVQGCVSINGNISLNLQTQPQQGTTNFQVISYNCSQQANISSSQIQVIPNYNGSSCDTINSQAINQQGSLGISLTSTLGNKCNGGNNLGLIIGLSVGIPCGMVLLGVSLAVHHYFKNKEFNQDMHNLGIEMKAAI